MEWQPARCHSDCDPCHNKPIDGKSGRHSSFGSMEWVTSLWSEKLEPPQVLALRQMVEHGSKYNAGSNIEGNCGRFRRGSSSGSLEKASTDDRQDGGGEINPGECWFTLETSPAER